MIQAWALEQDSSSRWDFAGTSSCNSSSKKKSVISADEGQGSSEKTSSGCGTAQQDVLVPWKLQKRFFLPTNGAKPESSTSHEMASQDNPSIDQESFDDVECNHVVRQDDGSLLFQRFCHVFKKGELEDLCSR